MLLKIGYGEDSISRMTPHTMDSILVAHFELMDPEGARKTKKYKVMRQKKG